VVDHDYEVYVDSFDQICIFCRTCDWYCSTGSDSVSLEDINGQASEHEQS